MEIKTKFNVGDEVWFIKDKVVKGIISFISITYNGNLEIKYDLFEHINLRIIERYKEIPEYKLYPTKEELINSL